MSKYTEQFKVARGVRVRSNRVPDMAKRHGVDEATIRKSWWPIGYTVRRV